jgi:hypothetical protein
VAAPKKFDPETRERAVRMYEARIAETGDSKRGARRHVEASCWVSMRPRCGTGSRTATVLAGVRSAR